MTALKKWPLRAVLSLALDRGSLVDLDQLHDLAAWFFGCDREEIPTALLTEPEGALTELTAGAAAAMRRRLFEQLPWLEPIVKQRSLAEISRLIGQLETQYGVDVELLPLRARDAQTATDRAVTTDFDPPASEALPPTLAGAPTPTSYLKRYGGVVGAGHAHGAEKSPSDKPSGEAASEGGVTSS